MDAVIAVVDLVGLATIQDGGRTGYAHVGVPVSGAFHRERYLIATALVTGRLDPRQPALELLTGDLHLTAAVDMVLAVVGPASVLVDDRRAAVGTTARVPARSQVRVRHEGPGPVYVVVAGWTPERTLGSSSTDTFSRLGGAIVEPGMRMVGVPDHGAEVRVGNFHRRLESSSGPVRVVAVGPRDAEAVANAVWTVSSTARSGTRLAVGGITGSGSVASMPVVPGAIQVTPDGEAIVLGPDGGLTGGYPVAGVVVTADLDRMSLLSAEDTVGFRIVDVETAARLWRERKAYLRRVVAHPTQFH